MTYKILQVQIVNLAKIICMQYQMWMWLCYSSVVYLWPVDNGDSNVIVKHILYATSTINDVQRQHCAR